MSSEVAIAARSLGKAYRIYRRPWDRVLQQLRFGPKTRYTQFWALRDVNLDVYRGEVVGIVGRNGAGKSTLLELIAGTLTASQGTLAVNGRVAALLELGTGFNPDFTGRENVLLNAAMLGFSKRETLDRMSQILEFASIGEFIDQPVRSYSSGMQARLAFAVAINAEPEILIVDEALSVGDEVFQRKCFARIQEIRKSGATILFVSHASSTVVELCTRAVLLDKGERLLSGPPKMVVAQYQRLASATSENSNRIRDEIRRLDRSSISMDRSLEAGGSPASLRHPGPMIPARFDAEFKPSSTVQYGLETANISNVRILDAGGKSVNVLVPGEVYRYCYAVVFGKHTPGVRFGMLIKTITGIELGGFVSAPSGEGQSFSSGQRVDIEFQFRNVFNPGVYFMNAGVLGWQDSEEVYLHRILDATAFRVERTPGMCATGMIDLSPVNSDAPPCSVILREHAYEAA